MAGVRSEGWAVGRHPDASFWRAKQQYKIKLEKLS